MRDKFEVEDIENWLFNGQTQPGFPESKLYGRNPMQYGPKQSATDVAPIGSGYLSQRLRIHSGSITDIQIEPKKKGAIATSNNGDLLTGCGFAVAKAIINAAGAGLQTELYNRFGVPKAKDKPEFAKKTYGSTEGRGYAITCDSYDMKTSHNIDKIEVLIVPVYHEGGVENMYYEAFIHCKDLDYIIVPMAGMTHPVLKKSSQRSAQFTINAFEKFMREYPDSNLTVIFSIFEDCSAELNYRNYALGKDEIFAKEQNNLSTVEKAQEEINVIEKNSSVDALVETDVNVIVKSTITKTNLSNTQASIPPTIPSITITVSETEKESDNQKKGQSMIFGRKLYNETNDEEIILNFQKLIQNKAEGTFVIRESRAFGMISVTLKGSNNQVFHKRFAYVNNQWRTVSAAEIPEITQKLQFISRTNIANDHQSLLKAIFDSLPFLTMDKILLPAQNQATIDKGYSGYLITLPTQAEVTTTTTTTTTTSTMTTTTSLPADSANSSASPAVATVLPGLGSLGIFAFQSTNPSFPNNNSSNFTDSASWDHF